MVSVLFIYFKTAAQYCSAMLSGAQCSAEVTHRPTHPRKTFEDAQLPSYSGTNSLTWLGEPVDVVRFQTLSKGVRTLACDYEAMFLTTRPCTQI